MRIIPEFREIWFVEIGSDSWSIHIEFDPIPIDRAISPFIYGPPGSAPIIAMLCTPAIIHRWTISPDQSRFGSERERESANTRSPCLWGCLEDVVALSCTWLVAPDILAISIRDVIQVAGCWIHFNRPYICARKNYHEIFDSGEGGGGL